MTTLKFSDVSTATAATSIAVSLGGSPAVGDLVVVFLGVSSEIVTHQPGWNTPTQWWQLQHYQCAKSQSQTLTCWVHTWNASDSGSSATFTFSPAPTLGVGDKDLPSANAVAVAAVYAAQTTYLETSVQGVLQAQTTVGVSPQKLPADLTLIGAYIPASAAFTNNDPTASVVQTVTAGSQTLTLFSATAFQVPYAPVITSSAYGELVAALVTLSASTNTVYNTPVVEEGPVAEDRLMFRYRLLRHYTVLNNAGTFSTNRYLSTDQLAAATQVFTNDAPVTSADRTNLLNSGIGGEFRALS